MHLLHLVGHRERQARFGASDQEIQEAVAMSALTRHWNTMLNGMQVDFDTFKKEMGGESAAKWSKVTPTGFCFGEVIC